MFPRTFFHSFDHDGSLPLLSIGLAAAQALGKRGAHVVISSRRQANVDKAVALLKSQSITVTGTTCNVGKGEDREKLVQTVRSQGHSV